MQKLLRGRVLTFHEEPQGAADHDSYRYIEDGALLLEGDRIIACDQYRALAHTDGVQLIDHRPHLLMAGFIDTHTHYPQAQVIASWGAQLLDWLNNYTFPEETRFADAQHCRNIASAFFDELIGHGTTTAVAYCTVHRESAEAYFSEAQQRNMRMIGGKALMDRNAPDGLRDTPQTGYDDSKALIEKWHGIDRLSYAITPRFAITSTIAQLELTGALVKEFPHCYVQTHLSENHDEIEYTKSLFPDARDYLDVYQRYGLLGRRSLLGNCLHLEQREKEALAETGSVAVFCPTSNLFLGSGLFDRDGLRQIDVRTAIATDVGGGTSYSMLQTLNEGYKVLQLNRQSMHALQAFHWITRGNAMALGMAECIGTLDVDSEADIVVLNSSATPAMALRMQTVSNLSDELFVLQMMGDDRAVEQVYIAGEQAK